MTSNNPLLGKALENLKKMESQLVEESRILTGIGEKENADNRELEILKAALEDRERALAGLNSALAEQSALLERTACETAAAKAALDREIQALRERLGAKSSEAADLEARLEKGRADFSAALGKAQESFNARERELSEEHRALKEAAGAAGLEAGRLRQAAQDAGADCAAAMGELAADRIKLTEQDVLTRSSLSALKEMKEDMGRLKAMLSDREADLSGLKAEMGRLGAEAKEEKLRSAEFKEKLAAELALKEDMEKLLASSAGREEALKREALFLNMDVKEKTGIIAYLTKEVTAARTYRGR